MTFNLSIAFTRLEKNKFRKDQCHAFLFQGKFFLGYHMECPKYYLLLSSEHCMCDILSISLSPKLYLIIFFPIWLFYQVNTFPTCSWQVRTCSLWAKDGSILAIFRCILEDNEDENTEMLHVSIWMVIWRTFQRSDVKHLTLSNWCLAIRICNNCWRLGLG
jgi:hypothetical protein